MLTVIATESYEQFAENLQKDIEKRHRHPVWRGDHAFAGIAVKQEKRRIAPPGFDAS